MSDGRKVRRLKWRREPFGWVADTPWGRYMIEPGDWPGSRGMFFASFRSGMIDAHCHATDEAAIKACQSDFDRRVTECLETSG